MSDDSNIMASARARSGAARAQFRSAAAEALEWLSPSRLKAEAAMVATQQIDEAKAALGRQVRSHPLAAWSGLAAVAALLTYMLRRPAVALARTGADTVGTLYYRITGRKA
ncbi:hypothetical protein BH10PSE13_BH10PSE13_01930 [soil metagenome]